MDETLKKDKKRQKKGKNSEKKEERRQKFGSRAAGKFFGWGLAKLLRAGEPICPLQIGHPGAE